MDIPIELDKELRAKTGAGVLECRKALEANKGDLERAIAFLREKGIQIKGDPVWARYNAPFVPWFLRRNEIMIEIE